MSKSPFQNSSLETAENDDQTPRFRRLQSPAERFRAGEIAREVEDLSSDETGTQSFDEIEQPDAELEPPDAATATAATAPDPFEHPSGVRPREEARARRGAETRRARRRLKQHAPHFHEKKPHAVSHKPIKEGAPAEPQNDWDKAAQNSMARAALARKKSRVRRILSRILLASGVLLATWAGATALTAPQFNVDRVEITGAQRTPPEKVRALAGQLVGQNVFRAPRGSVEQQIEAIPVVASAQISRVWSWPPHMKVQIAERQPLLQVGSGTTWWVADAQGVPFRRADRNDSHLDMLTSPLLQPATGKPLPATQWKSARQLEAAIAADNALVAGEKGATGNGKFWDLRRIYLDKDGAAALRISDKGSLKAHGETLVRLGDEGWPEKLKQARVALAFFERTGRKASEVDLVSSQHPRWRPKAEPTPEKSSESSETERSEDVQDLKMAN